MATKRKPAHLKKSITFENEAAFEKLLKQAGRVEHYQLKLFITGNTPRSSRAIANIRTLCEQHLPGHYDLEVIDIYQQPGQAAGQQIIAAPTLIKELPIPAKRLVGDLSDHDKVLICLNITRRPAPELESKKT